MIIISQTVSADLNKTGLSIDNSSRLDGFIEYEPFVSISHNCFIRQARIGAFTYIMQGCDVHRCSIGRYCSIAADVSLVWEDHPTDWLSTSPMLYQKPFAGYGQVIEGFTFDGYKPINIGHDVWIGAKVSVMRGVDIGQGAIIGANAVVTRDVEPYTIVGGCPARVIRKRFSDQIIERILSLKWTDYDLVSWSKAERRPGFDRIDHTTINQLEADIHSGKVPRFQPPSFRLDESNNGQLRLKTAQPW